MASQHSVTRLAFQGRRLAAHSLQRSRNDTAAAAARPSTLSICSQQRCVGTHLQHKRQQRLDQLGMLADVLCTGSDEQQRRAPDQHVVGQLAVRCGAYHGKLTVGSAVSTAPVYVVSSNSMQDPTLRTQKRATSMPCLGDDQFRKRRRCRTGALHTCQSVLRNNKL